MHRIHSGFTVAAAIKDGESGHLRILLKLLSIGKNNCLTNFNGSETTLFVSGVILPAQDYFGEMLPETFVFATSFCGPFSTHLEDLIKTSKKGLCEIFKHCLDFPEENLITDEFLAYYLKSHRYPSAFNSRYNCITKKDVREEKELRNEIENYLDKAQNLNAFNLLSALEVKTLIQQHIKTHGPEYEWALKPARKSLIEFFVTNRVNIIIGLFFFMLVTAFLLYYPVHISLFLKILIAALLPVAIFIILILVLLMLLPLLLYITRKRNVTAPRPKDSYVRKITATQLHPVINEMTAAAPLKKGRLRRHFYATALRIISFIAPYVMDVPTVSSLRWLVIDNKKRLIFISNYSNTTDFYVRDFLIGNTPRGVNFMFSNGIGFPDAKLLLYKGITSNPEGYMNAVHTGQHVTDLWYAHEPSLTADIINNNRKIRNGLFKRMSENKAIEWLRLL